MAGRLRAAALPWRYAALSLVASLVVGLAYLMLRDVPVVSALEGQTLDWRFQLRGVRAPPSQAVIIAIDDHTLEGLGHWPVKREELATAVGKIAADGPSAIGFDLLLLQPEQPSNGSQFSPGDQALLHALRSANRAVLPLPLTFDPAAKPGDAAREAAGAAAFRVVTRPVATAANEDGILRGTDLAPPLGPFAGAASLGHVTIPNDSGGTVRYIPIAVAFGDYYLPAFPLELVRRALGLPTGAMALALEGRVTLGDDELLLGPRLSLPINYYGPAGTLPTYSFIDLLQDRIPASAISGRVVLLGATALGGDNFVTPFGQVKGVEILATVTDNLLAGQVLQRAALKGWDFAAIMLLGLATFALARLPQPFAAVGAAIVMLVLWSTVVLIAFRRDLWLDMTFPVAVILVNAGGVAMLRAGIERRMRRNLARYHSPAIVDLLAESATPSFGGSQDAAVLFVDIAGSTTRVERMAPEATVRFLRDFHARIERAMLAHGGVLEQFMGDGAMVVFGVPVPGPGDAASALGAAHDLLDDIRAHNEELQARGETPFRVAIGIHCGPVVMARLGGPTQAQISTSGDTVNVASRLEKLTRAHGAAIAISGAVVDAVKAAGRTELLEGFEQVATDSVRGRAGHLTIWVKKEPVAAER